MAEGSTTTTDVPRPDALTTQAVQDLAVRWYQALDRHDDVESVLGFLVDNDLEMRFPEGTSRGHRGFRDWYAAVTGRFFDETHRLAEVTITSTEADAVELAVVVNWQARMWNPPAAKSEWVGFDAYQTWRVVARPGDHPRIQRYVVDELRPMPGSAALTSPGQMGTAEVVTRYYERANAGNWAAWCDLFAADQVMDEQLAGHVEGVATLRAMMASFPQTYPQFANVLKHLVVSGAEAMTVSHISARTANGATIEANVANYFRVVDGHIAYMANFHDTVPFTRAVAQRWPAMDESSGGQAATGVRALSGPTWSHVGLNCRDQARTEEFYRRWFGFRRVRVFDLGGGQEIVFLRNGSALIELFPAAGEMPAAAGDGPRQAGAVRHLAFHTDDLALFLADIGEHAPVSLGPLDFDNFIAGWRSVWLTDPDGVVVEVSQGYRDSDSSADACPQQP